MNTFKRLALCWRIMRAKPGGSLAHAKRELPPADGDNMQALMNQQLLELVLVFSTHGHSGFSASYATSALGKLLAFEPLGPLTGEPDEWIDHGYSIQNNRASHVFMGDKDRFDGAAYDIQAVVFREPNGSCFTGKGSSQPVTFPYTPRTIYVDVDDTGMPLDGWDREGVCPRWEA